MSTTEWAGVLDGLGLTGGRGRCVVVVAHPDDEIIGAGILLARLRHVTVVHVTDGSPGNPTDAAAAGCATREEYAEIRGRESENALSLAGVRPPATVQLGHVDQEASLGLAPLTRILANVFATIRPEVLLTHPYEGGHPDHDATAFAVHAARKIVMGTGASEPQVFEFTSYHENRGSMAVSEFLPDANCSVFQAMLSPEERDRKRRMLACYVSQQRVLQGFPVNVERFRRAPSYRFTAAPHPGKLYYERFDWGMDGARWRMLAGEALDSLGISEPL